MAVRLDLASHQFAIFVVVRHIQIVKCQVMDYDKFSADDLCGSCTVKVSDLHLGYNACCLETIPAFAVYVLWCMA